MKKIGISISCLFICLLSYSNKSDTSKKKLNLSIVIEQRITPIYLSGFQDLIKQEDIITPIFYAQDEQLNGTATGYELSYLFKKINSFIIFSQSFRYDHIFFNTGDLALTNNQVNLSVNNLITDYHFKIQKSIDLKNNFALNVRVGYSFMNRGTAYSYTRQIGEFQGDPIYSTTHNDFNFSAFDFELGVEKNNFNITIGSYLTDKHKYNQPSQLLLPKICFIYKFL